MTNRARKDAESVRIYRQMLHDIAKTVFDRTGHLPKFEELPAAVSDLLRQRGGEEAAE